MLEELTLAIFSFIFFCKMCVFVSRPMKIVTFLRKNADPQNGWLIFHGKERDTFRNKTMDIAEDFDEKSYNNNGKPWKSSTILRVNPNLFIFSFFIIFLHFFVFFLLFIFSVFFIYSFFHIFHFLVIFPFFHFFNFFIFHHF